MTRTRLLPTAGLAGLLAVALTTAANAAPPATSTSASPTIASTACVRAAGAVLVTYSTADGVLGGRSQLWTQNAPGLKGLAGEFHRFGASLAGGDLDGDGEADLAIGIPGGTIQGHGAAGAVTVRGTDEMVSQASGGVKGAPEDGDHFGRSLAAGDFDGDRRWDLVAAAPRDSVQGFPEAGAVNVIYGHRGGLREDADELWTQGTRGIKGAVGSDRFGTALGSGAPGG